MKVNEKQKSAINAFLKALAALAMAFVTGEAEASEPEAEEPEAAEPEGVDDLLGGGDTGDASDLLGDTTPPPPAPVPATPAPAKKKAGTKAATPAPTAPAAPTPPVQAPPVNPEALLADARGAAVLYAQKHGREKLRELLNAYTKGTIADIDKAKLSEVIAKLKA